MRKRTKLPRRKSDRQKLIEVCDRLFFRLLQSERGEECEICGKKCNLTPFHILPKGTYPRIRYSRRNVLLTGWFCCHHLYHHDFHYTEKNIVPQLKKLRGKNYKQDLMLLDKVNPRMTMTQLNAIRIALQEGIY